MAALNITLDIPYETKGINITALKADLVAFAKILLTSPSIVTSVPKTVDDPFAELDTSWGGDRDANEIADELHSMRTDTRTIEPW